MRIDTGEDEQPEISLVALIDCIFFLLMFFMVATSFKQQDLRRRQKELPIVLPSADFSLEAAQGTPETPLVLAVARDGQVYVDGAVVSAQALHQRLRAEAAARPGRRVRIDGDRRTPYQHIVRVLDLCRFEGLANIALRTLD